MSIRADMYYSIRSPYSYLGIRRLEALLPLQALDIEIDIRPVLPIAARMPELFKRANPGAIRYLEHDTRRAAAQLGVGFRIWPQPDPIVQNMETLEIAEEQPHIHPLTRRLVYACERGSGFDYTLRLAKLIWDASVDDWNSEEQMRKVADDAGLSYDEMESVIVSDAERLDAVVDANQAALAAAGHWGVPTIVFEGEPFFGQDRIETFLWRVEQANGQA